MNRPMKLATANGVINADTRMMMDVSILGNALDPIVLENTVDVLSLGRLVLDNGYDFPWTREHGATLVIDGGKEIKRPIKGYVRMLVDVDIRDSSTHEAPALPSEATIDDEQFHVPVPEVELEGDVEVHGLLGHRCEGQAHRGSHLHQAHDDPQAQEPDVRDLP